MGWYFGIMEQYGITNTGIILMGYGIFHFMWFVSETIRRNKIKEPNKNIIDEPN
jgi:hypothetical protein